MFTDIHRHETTTKMLSFLSLSFLFINFFVFPLPISSMSTSTILWRPFLSRNIHTREQSSDLSTSSRDNGSFVRQFLPKRTTVVRLLDHRHPFFAGRSVRRCSLLALFVELEEFLALHIHSFVRRDLGTRRTMVWERPILRKKYYLRWKCSEIARNVSWRLNLIVFYLVHIRRGLYTDWLISLYVITFWPELTRIWEKSSCSMIDFFHIFLLKKWQTLFDQIYCPFSLKRI